MIQAIYKFGRGIDTGMIDKYVVGGKGANLAEMGSNDLPIPFGVTITTAECNNYLTLCTTDLSQSKYAHDLVVEVLDGYQEIIEDLGYMPLVSVRSGACVSMPGMMDTILNVGINHENYPEWVERLGDEAAEDCYKRFMIMYGDVVLGIPTTAFEDCLDLTDYFDVYEDLTGELPPQTIEAQLAGCIAAVFNSWNSTRAKAYRAIHDYPDDWGTAVTVQKMVFGNRNNKSASGVLFTRDFNTGESELVIDWLPNAQGEDVVAGTHTPNTKAELYDWSSDLYDELRDVAVDLERYYNDMQDIEFTIDDGELFILQTRDGKRSAQAAFKIAWDMVEEEMILPITALKRVTAKQYIALQNPSINPSFTEAPCITGIGAAGKIVTGIAVLSSADAVSCTEDCILVTKETTPNDFPGMAASVGILTQTGGITSHAAVVARGMDKVCVVGVENLKFVGLAGKRITINGETGDVWLDKDVPVVVGRIPEFVEEMINWADTKDNRFLSVRPESVPTDETVYVDVSDTLNTMKSLTQALTEVKASKGNGILGFGRNTPMQEVDSEFMGFFGVEANTYDEGTYAVIEKVLVKALWTKKFKKQWTLHLPSGTDELLVIILRQHGWKIVTVVNSFKTALFLADGYVVMDEKFTAQLKTEKMTFAKIEELIVKDGREVKELPDRVTKERLLFDVLGQ